MLYSTFLVLFESFSLDVVLQLSSSDGIYFFLFFIFVKNAFEYICIFLISCFENCTAFETLQNNKKKKEKFICIMIFMRTI